MTEGFASTGGGGGGRDRAAVRGDRPECRPAGRLGTRRTRRTGLRSFGLACVEAFAGVVPVVKPQVAFFERLGSAGMAALEEVLAAARDAGLVTIADAKRGDIGSTMAAYASAWLDPASPLVADAVTVMPYMGIGALRPALDLAAAGGRGVIVVTRSSNPEGRSLQTAVTATGPSVEDAAARRGGRARTRAGSRCRARWAWSSGPPSSPSAFDLAGLGGVILAPGFGAQGGTTETVRTLFGGCAPGTVLPSASRSLLSEGPDVGTLRAAAARECAALRDVLG